MSFCVILVSFLGQCHFYVTFMSLRCHWKSFLFGVILVSFLCQFDVILVSFKCHFSVILATFLSHFCVILETIFNVIFVRCLCRFGVILVSFWCHTDVIWCRYFPLQSNSFQLRRIQIRRRCRCHWLAFNKALTFRWGDPARPILWIIWKCQR